MPPRAKRPPRRPPVSELAITNAMSMPGSTMMPAPSGKTTKDARSGPWCALPLIRGCVVDGPAEAHHPVGFPVAPTILRESLFPARAAGRDVRPQKAHAYRPALVRVGAFKPVHAPRKGTDHRWLQHAIAVADP